MATGRIYTRDARARDGKIVQRNLVRLHRDVDAALLLGRVLDLAFAKREQGVVLADADVVAGVPFGAALTDDDVAGKNALAARLLDAEAPAGRIAAVARGAACFLVCHLGLSLFFRLGSGLLRRGLRLRCRLLRRRLRFGFLGRLLRLRLLLGLLRLRLPCNL